MEEVWKKLPEYDNKYAISNFGNLKNLHTGKILRKNIAPNGGVYYVCYRDKIRHSRSATQLVANAFLPKPDKANRKVECIDGNKNNIAVNNLRWRMTTYNDKIKKTFYVYDQKKCLIEQHYGYNDYAKKVGVSPTFISSVIRYNKNNPKRYRTVKGMILTDFKIKGVNENEAD